MALKDQPKELQGAPEVPSSNVTGSTGSNTGSSTGNNATTLDDVLKPFQEAATRLLQANLAAQESAFKQRAKAELDYQDEVRNVEQEAYRAVTAATRKHLDQLRLHRPEQRQDRRQVVKTTVRLHLLEEPEALLSERQRRGALPPLGGRHGLWPAPGAVLPELLLQQRQLRRRELSDTLVQIHDAGSTVADLTDSRRSWWT